MGNMDIKTVGGGPPFMPRVRSMLRVEKDREPLYQQGSNFYKFVTPGVGEREAVQFMGTAHPGGNYATFPGHDRRSFAVDIDLKKAHDILATQQVVESITGSSIVEEKTGLVKE